MQIISGTYDIIHSLFWTLWTGTGDLVFVFVLATPFVLFLMWISKKLGIDFESKSLKFGEN